MDEPTIPSPPAVPGSPLATAGGAAQRKYERLTAEAEGAQPGSSAAEAKRLFEEQWASDPAHAQEEAEVEEKSREGQVKKAKHPPRKHR